MEHTPMTDFKLYTYGLKLHPYDIELHPFALELHLYDLELHHNLSICPLHQWHAYQALYAFFSHQCMKCFGQV